MSDNLIRVEAVDSRSIVRGRWLVRGQDWSTVDGYLEAIRLVKAQLAASGELPESWEFNAGPVEWIDNVSAC